MRTTPLAALAAIFLAAAPVAAQNGTPATSGTAPAPVVITTPQAGGVGPVLITAPVQGGQTGRDGRDGQPGAQGLPGLNGTTGADGRDGRDGRDGQPGPTGPAGSNAGAGGSVSMHAPVSVQVGPTADQLAALMAAQREAADARVAAATAQARIAELERRLAEQRACPATTPQPPRRPRAERRQAPRHVQRCRGGCEETVIRTRRVIYH